MKTRILTIVAVAFMAMVSTKTTFANTFNGNENEATVLTHINKINKIEIHGNVELYISDGDSDKVKVYNKYYAENALIQSQNGVLRISSYTDQKLVVWVTAADLQAIAAYDNAEVRSFGNLSKIELDLKLYNSATADLKLEAYKANIIVNDASKVTLAGTVNDYSIAYTKPANVEHDKLVSVNAVKTQLQPIAQTNNLSSL